VDEFGKYGESKYAALIGDVVASRQIAQRAQLQSKLQARLESNR